MAAKTDVPIHVILDQSNVDHWKVCEIRFVSPFLGEPASFEQFECVVRRALKTEDSYKECRAVSLVIHGDELTNYLADETVASLYAGVKALAYSIAKDKGVIPVDSEEI